MSRPHATRTWFFLIALVVLIVDRLSKWAIADQIPLHENLSVIPGFFRITHVQNRGAAFGLLSESPASWTLGALILFSLIALVVVSMLLWKNSNSVTWTGIGLALVLGGTLGNLWDRLMDGHVIDFLDFSLWGYHWPAFNAADTAIVAGALLLVVEIVFARPPVRKKAASSR
ncbi:MAG TPA: signal peptidase II [Terriglobales bacterium]|jgi:signal peptidase II|nr:signal peptidase II [Terriglobales bacterium]